MFSPMTFFTISEFAWCVNQLRSEYIFGPRLLFSPLGLMWMGQQAASQVPQVYMKSFSQ